MSSLTPSKTKKVEAAGFEPATSGVRFQRSPSELRPHNFCEFCPNFARMPEIATPRILHTTFDPLPHTLNFAAEWDEGKDFVFKV